MKARAYYNEINPFAAQWLRNLIKAGLIAPGDVDERSVVDVRADDLRGYRQCHFFAGIGIWSHALRLAGVGDEEEVWTGSCPCQPFSVAGQRQGDADKRHLWPAFHCLIAECKPPVVFGEQVAGADGREWFAGIRADLEATGYACGGADLCSAGVGAPNIRQRLYWVAYASDTGARRDGGASAGEEAESQGERRQYRDIGDASQSCGGDAITGLANAGHEHSRRSSMPGEAQGRRSSGEFAGCGDDAIRLGDSESIGRTRRTDDKDPRRRQCASRQAIEGDADRLGHTISAGLEIRERNGRVQPEAMGALAGQAPECAGNASGGWFRYEPPGEWHRGLAGWARADVPQWNGPTIAVQCKDGIRRVSAQPGAFPLASGYPQRMGRLRAYGNAINAKLAAEFIKASFEAIVLQKSAQI